MVCIKYLEIIICIENPKSHAFIYQKSKPEIDFNFRYGPDIQCEPRSCGQPQDPSNGWHAGECYTFGCRISYHCSEGYELVGKSDRFCQATGDWSPKELPTCVRK